MTHLSLWKYFTELAYSIQNINNESSMGQQELKLYFMLPLIDRLEVLLKWQPCNKNNYPTLLY